MTDIASRFYTIVNQFTEDKQLAAACWDEIYAAYNLPQRHYHTLQHIEQMLALLDEVKEDCADLEAIQLAIFYHDIVYDAQRQDNEAQSAALASERLSALGYRHTGKIAALILATQKHERAEDKDTNYLLDTDLAVLGADWPRYGAYARQVRSEYRIYPDAVYNPGRVKVLQYFLGLPHIFKTDYFYRKLEAQARANLQKEIIQLS